MKKLDEDQKVTKKQKEMSTMITFSTNSQNNTPNTKINPSGMSKPTSHHQSPQQLTKMKNKQKLKNPTHPQLSSS